MSLKPSRVNPILVRTCYEPDLEEAWSQLAGMGHDSLSAELDNSELNNVADAWPRVLIIRVPDIIDTGGARCGPKSVARGSGAGQMAGLAG